MAFLKCTSHSDLFNTQTGHDTLQKNHQHTVPTFNSCTKYMGNSGKMDDRTPKYHPVVWAGCMDDLTIECSFDSQATWVIGVLGLIV